ncbi:MAG: VacJ family lipoprotein [Marinobacterium sp.]|nr:VacJ family lipoprotein [Marinobacterium sp.]
MLIKTLTAAVLLSASLVVQAADSSESEYSSDPLEGLNRVVFSFNDTLDGLVVKPLAQGYRFVTPDLLETGVSNVFDNLGEVSNILNSGLQGKVEGAVTSAVRLVFNSTIGLFGVLDVATPMGLQEQDEDFGQTLAVWGVDSGPYLVLPLLGPSTVRDTVGLTGDYLADPVSWIDDTGDRNAATLVRVIDARSRLLMSESLISGDRYSFIRDAYLQRRDFSINDGEITEFDDDNF